MYQNPLAGGALLGPQENQLQGDALVERMQMRMQQRDVKTPAFLAYFKDVMDTKGYPTKTMEEYGGQFPLSGLLEQANPLSGAQQATPSTPTNNFFSQVTPPNVPVGAENELQGDALVNSIMIQMQQQNIKSPAFNAYAKDVIETKGYPTKTMQEYRIEFPSTIGTLLPLSEQTPMSGLRDSDGNPLPNFTPIRSPGLPQPTDPAGLQEAIRTVDPIVSGDNSIASTQTVNPFQEQFTGFQNQLTGFGDQFTSLNDRLTKIEEGISSLLGNRGQGLNLGYNPMMNFGMGIGSLFQPMRGFYGQRF